MTSYLLLEDGGCQRAMTDLPWSRPFDAWIESRSPYSHARWLQPGRDGRDGQQHQGVTREPTLPGPDVLASL